MNGVDFGKLFNSLCDSSGKTNTEIAKGLNVDKATVGRWRSGERSPKLSSLPDIADYFNVDIQIFSKSKTERHYTAPEVIISGWVGSLINPKHREENQEKIKLLDKLSSMDDQEISFMNSVADSILEKRKKTSIDDQT